MLYEPSCKVLEKYAGVLVNFALGCTKGIQKGEIVHLVIGEHAKKFLPIITKTIMKAGGKIYLDYIPDGFEKYIYQYGNKEQIKYVGRELSIKKHEKTDHFLVILGDYNVHELDKINPKKIMIRMGEKGSVGNKRLELTEEGKLTWTLAIWGTESMAKEANLSLKEYWDQIIKACFLDKKEPISCWKKIYDSQQNILSKLNNMELDKFHIEGKDIDLNVKIGEKRKWIGGDGANIPSFEIFTSPDWRGTNGKIKFNMPLYRYGNLIKGISLEFKNGKIIKAKADSNQKLLDEMIAIENMNKIGEVSLTDKRHSHINKFMAHTLYDENFGGDWGNTHIALGRAFAGMCTKGNTKMLTKKDYQNLGYNESSEHVDLISTSNRKVIAELKNGKKILIYENGEFKT